MKTPPGGEELHFRVSANLQRLIGRELVPNDQMAVVELVKNAYDSRATKVEISISPSTQSRHGSITISDNGSGMSLDDLRRHFMVVAYSSRTLERSQRARIPTGEKGIGRFAADKLGRLLTLATKQKDARLALQLSFDWRDFESSKKLFTEIPAQLEHLESPYFKPRDSGTILRIESLRSEWSRDKIVALRQWLLELFNPYSPPEQFEINLSVEGAPTLSGQLESLEPTGGDIELSFAISNKGAVSRRVQVGHEAPARDAPLSNVDTTKLVGLAGRFIYSEKKLTKTQSNGLPPAVRLFRDGFRIDPFGTGADWLGVAAKRAKRAGHAHIVPSRLFGFIDISRDRHSDLADTTSRQALLESDSATALVGFLREQLDALEDLIRTKIAEPRWKENRKRQTAEFEQARLQTLGVLSFGLAHELRQPLQTIRSESKNIATRLGQLNITDTDVNEAQESIDRNVERIDRNIELISEISKGSIDDIQSFDLSLWIKEECLAIFGTRCNSLGIRLRMDGLPTRQPAQLSKAAVAALLLNLVKNAIEAIQERKSGPRGTITINLSLSSNVHILSVEDNGSGMSPEIRAKIFRKFASKKTGGLGVGLYYCKAVAEACNGTISFESTQSTGTTFSVKLPNGVLRKAVDE